MITIYSAIGIVCLGLSIVTIVKIKDRLNQNKGKKTLDAGRKNSRNLADNKDTDINSMDHLPSQSSIQYIHENNSQHFAK